MSTTGYLSAEQKLAQLPSDKRSGIEQFISSCRDPVWRLHNLYKIKDARARVIPFRPNAEQAFVIDAVYRRGQRRIIIVKARQLGFSTAIALMFFDAVYWGKNIRAGIVDRTQPDAHDKLKEKAKFAHEMLPEAIKREPLISNESQLAFGTAKDASSLIAGKNIRGGTYNLVHISEAGPIAHEDPSRYREIQTGVFPAAEKGTIIIETTMEGGKSGELYRLIKGAQEIPAEQRTDADWHVYFFPWYSDASYSLDGDSSHIPPDIHNYFDEKERELGRTFTAGQRLWYSKKKAEQGIYMLREYPTTIEEAFAAPVEGSIYGDIISRIRAGGQIRDFLWDRAYPVYSVWDIGWSDSTSVWLFQVIGGDVHWIWHMRERQLTAAEAWGRVVATGIPVMGVFLPHDGGNKSAVVGLSYKDAMERAGAVNVVVLPRASEIWAGIDAARGILGRSVIHKTACAVGIEALEAYHTRDASSGGVISKEPVHDWSSHDADAFRYGAEAIRLGYVKTVDGRRMNAGMQRAASPQVRAAVRDISQWLKL